MPRIKVYRIADHQWRIWRAEAWDRPSIAICLGTVCVHIYRKKATR